jgi:hypothetical protein
MSFVERKSFSKIKKNVFEIVYSACSAEAEEKDATFEAQSASFQKREVDERVMRSNQSNSTTLIGAYHL